MRAFAYLPDVVTLKLDPDKCVGCGMCTVVCPHQVFAMQNKKARMVKRDDCMECGACAMNCPSGAIEVDSGVGCASGLISQALGLNKKSQTCC